MTASTFMQLVGPTDASEKQATLLDIANSLRDGTGAWACYLMIGEHEGQPVQIVFSANTTDILPPWSEAQSLPTLHRTLNDQEPLAFEINQAPALALPLLLNKKALGAALLFFANGTLLDRRSALGVVQLVARLIHANHEMGALHLQAEQIVERTRLREIQISRNLIRGVIDSIPMGLALIDAEGVVLAVNRALADRFGREPAALVGTLYNDAIAPWDDSPAAQTFISGVPERVRRTMLGPDRVQVLLEIVSLPLLDHAGNPHQVVEIWENITERVVLQTQLVRAEKLAAIGQLAASIAHEVGNPLQAIQGFLALFLEQCPPEITNQHFLKLAEEEIERIVQVLARLRDLYRPRADVVAPTSLNELVDGVLLLTSKQLERARILVRRELAPNLPDMYVVADQIKQVLLNLILNAAEAMSEGGVLHIQTYEKDDRSGNRTVMVIIADTGVGIAPELLSHVFDGLHTTKERGMGLGLYTSKAIIERHMGRISVQSTLGEGTTFIISLPVKEDDSVQS